jgi:hypothetical protein
VPSLYWETELDSWLIYGGGVAPLVFSDLMSGAGHEVTLIAPGKQWGGIFNGIQIGDTRFDVGMTNFEFDLFTSQCKPIDEYDPDLRGDLGKHIDDVKKYLGRHVNFHALPALKMAFEGKFHDDLIISNHFEVLHALAPSVREAIQFELADILAKPNPLHPSRKYASDSLLQHKTFEAVSVANHGKTLHSLFIKPMLRKVLGIGAEEIEAGFHRNGWVPLFYPETLASQFGSTPQCLKPTLFHYPDTSHFGAFITRIQESLSERPNVRLITSASEVSIDRKFNTFHCDRGSFNYSRLVWGGDLSALSNAIGVQIETSKGATRHASLNLYFVEVAEQGISNESPVVLDPETDSPIFRVTNQTLCAGTTADSHKVIIESHANSSSSDENVTEFIRSRLPKYGINPDHLISLEHRSFANALKIPSQIEWDQFAALRLQLLSEMPKLELIGPAAGYLAVTLNDQIIQALRLGYMEGAFE